jgi:7-cyano-7-deazaguanine synthase
VTNLVGGMCLTDYSGYPDCRPDFMRAMELTLQAGLNKRFEIMTPLIIANEVADLGHDQSL